MPMESIDDIQVIAFADSLHVRAQQELSRLRPFCEYKGFTGDIWAYDGLGTVEARKLTGRFNPTTFADIEHNRRKLSRDRYEVTLGIDEYDMKGVVADLQGKYVNAIAMAMERQLDEIIADAALASVYTGRNMDTLISASTDGVRTVNATAGLTLAKLLEIQQNWIDDEVMDEAKRKAFAISGKENTTLLQIQQLTSGDFTRGQLQLDQGSITKAVGLDILHFGANSSKPILNVAAGVRSCIAMAQGGVCIGMSKEWTTRVERRPDLVDTWQVQITGFMGAVRTEGKLVQEVTTTV